MSLPTFSEWLSRKNEDVSDQTTGTPNTAGPDVNMAAQMVKSKLTKVDPKKPVAHQARQALAQAAVQSNNPMAVAQLDNTPNDPMQGTA